MNDLYGIWIQELRSDFMLILTSSHSYFIISRDFFSGDDLAMEWGTYTGEFINVDPIPIIARMDFRRNGYDGSDRNYLLRLRGDWVFSPPNPSEIDILYGGDRLVRCHSIQWR